MSILSKSNEDLQRIPKLGYLHWRFKETVDDLWNGSSSYPIYNVSLIHSMAEELRDKHIEDLTKEFMEDLIKRYTGDDWHWMFCSDNGYKDERCFLYRAMGTPKNDNYGRKHMSFVIIDPILYKECGRAWSTSIPEDDETFLGDEFYN